MDHGQDMVDTWDRGWIRAESQLGTVPKEVECYGLSTPTIRVCMAPSEDR